MSTQVTDVPGLVHEYLVEEYGESQKERARGFFVSQSFKELLKFIDDNEIIELKARRHVKNKSESHPTLGMGPVGEYTNMQEELRVHFDLEYSRQEHGEFDSEGVLNRIKDKDLRDIPIERVVFRKENDELHEHLLNLLVKTLNLPDKNEFTQPFYFVMESRQADTKHLKRLVKDYHDDEYFMKDGLGWKFRTLDLMAIWSHNAYTDSKNVLFTDPNAGRKLTMKDVENLAINQYDSDKPVYGAINSKLVINKWRSIFGNGRTDMRRWVWDDTSEWVRDK